MNIIIIFKINIGYLNVCRFIIGCFIVSWWIENRIRLIILIISEMIIVGLDYLLEFLFVLLNLNIMLLKLIVDRMIDNILIFGFVMLDIFCMYVILKISVSIRNGREI